MKIHQPGVAGVTLGPWPVSVSSSFSARIKALRAWRETQSRFSAYISPVTSPMPCGLCPSSTACSMPVTVPRPSGEDGELESRLFTGLLRYAKRICLSPLQLSGILPFREEAQGLPGCRIMEMSHLPWSSDPGDAGLVARWPACLPGRGPHPLNQSTLPDRNSGYAPRVHRSGGGTQLATLKRAARSEARTEKTSLLFHVRLFPLSAFSGQTSI